MKKFIQFFVDNKKWLLFTLAVSVLVGFGVYYFKPTEVSLSYPYLMKVISPNQFSCESLVSSFTYGADKTIERGKEIVANVAKGTDKIAIEIEDDKLYFLSSASQQAGTARGVAWNIVKNTDKKVVATLSNPVSSSFEFNIFILNKENGIGLWTKTREEFITSNNPDAQSFYLICR